MGTFNVRDAITNEIICEDEKVVCIVLSEFKASPIAHASNSRHRIACFPLSGTWDGNYVVPDDDMSFSSTVNQIAAQSGHGFNKSIPSTFLEVQQKINSTPNINGVNHSLMIIKEGTVGLLKSLEGMSFLMGGLSVEGEIAKSKAIAEEYMRIYEQHNQGDNSNGTLRILSQLKDVIEFKSHYTHINNLEVPLVGSALIPDSLCAFSPLLVEIVEEMYGYEGYTHYIHEYGELPKEYDEIVRKLHEGMFIAKALDHIGLQLRPSMSTILTTADDPGFELSTKLIGTVLAQKLAFAQEKQSLGCLHDIDKHIDTLKQILADTIRQRKIVGRDIEKGSGQELN